MTRHLTVGAALCVLFMATSAPAQSTWHVDDDNCPGPGTGTVLDPYCSIQQAIDLVPAGDVIIVAPGTYHEKLDFGGKAVTLRSAEGADVTTVDGSGLGGSTVTCNSGEGPDTTLQGFTITGGTGDPATGTGGGMLIDDGSSPTVSDCTFTGNSTQFAGGGMFNYLGSPNIERCLFAGNSAGYLGGGLANFFSGARFTDCTFSGNTVSGAGGGMYNEGTPSATVIHCSFTDNTAQLGGGMYDNDANPVLMGCLFAANSASLDGGALANVYSEPLLCNCTFSGNTATGFGGAIHHEGTPGPTVTQCTFTDNGGYLGGGLYASFSTELTVANSILWNNSPDQIFDSQSSTTVRFSDIQGGWAGAGEHNIDQDPLWVDPAGPDQLWGTADDDLRLPAGSACIDSADNDSVPPDALDLDGDGNTTEPVPVDGSGDPRCVDDADAADCPQAPGQCGAPPVVDMGAFERQAQVVCQADLNGDARVDAADLGMLLGSWGPNPDHPADLNEDGLVDAADLALLLGNWGCETPP